MLCRPSACTMCTLRVTPHLILNSLACPGPWLRIDGPGALEIFLPGNGATTESRAEQLPARSQTLFFRLARRGRAKASTPELQLPKQVLGKFVEDLVGLGLWGFAFYRHRASSVAVSLCQSKVLQPLDELQLKTMNQQHKRSHATCKTKPSSNWEMCGHVSAEWPIPGGGAIWWRSSAMAGRWWDDRRSRRAFILRVLCDMFLGLLMSLIFHTYHHESEAKRATRQEQQLTLDHRRLPNLLPGRPFYHFYRSSRV